MTNPKSRVSVMLLISKIQQVAQLSQKLCSDSQKSSASTVIETNEDNATTIGPVHPPDAHDEPNEGGTADTSQAVDQSETVTSEVTSRHGTARLPSIKKLSDPVLDTDLFGRNVHSGQLSPTRGFQTTVTRDGFSAYRYVGDLHNTPRELLEELTSDNLRDALHFEDLGPVDAPGNFCHVYLRTDKMPPPLQRRPNPQRKQPEISFVTFAAECSV